MKKLLMAAIGLMMAMSVNAQYLNSPEKVFYEGKWMIGASASGLDLSWHKGQKWNLSLDAKAGYLIVDDFMITGKFVGECGCWLALVYRGERYLCGRRL